MVLDEKKKKNKQNGYNGLQIWFAKLRFGLKTYLFVLKLRYQRHAISVKVVVFTFITQKGESPWSYGT